jgi:hypothetical protein
MTTTKTGPKALQLESSTGLPPLARQWIKALVAENAALIRETVEADIARAASAAQSLPARDPRVDDLLNRIEYLERRAESDERYVLTKGKIIELMKKHGIE